MASKAELARILAAAASGVLFALAQNFHPLWPALWVAPIPLLVSAFLSGFGETWGLVLIAGLIGAAPLAAYYVQVATAVAAALIIGLQVLELGALVQIARMAARRGPAWVAPLAFPLAAAGLDTLAAAVSPHGSAASWAYSQMDFLMGIQVAALGGAAAVVFLPALFASTVAFALVHRRLAACAVPLALLAAGLGFGFGRLALAKPEPAIPVAIGALDGLSIDPKGAGGPTDPTLGAYLGLAHRLSAGRPALIVFPEHIEDLDAAAAAAARARVSAAARAAGATVVIGEGLAAKPQWLNVAWGFGPDGGELAAYVKHHPVPGLERKFAHGTGLSVIEVGGRRLGLAICKDMDFAAPASDYAGLGVAALIVPAWDFDRDGWLHGRMAVLRGVEHGFGVIRSARDGVMSVSDRFGRILAEAPTMAAARSMGDRWNGTPHGETTLAASASLGPGALTPYDRGGWLFGWACLILAVLARFALARRGEHAESPGDLSAFRRRSLRSRR